MNWINLYSIPRIVDEKKANKNCHNFFVFSEEEHQKESLIENLHRLDLSMEEKGLGIYAYFKTKGITLTPKELADVMNNIAVRKNRNVILKNTEKDVDEICSEIGLHPSAIKKWLEFLSVPQELANALHNIFFFQQNENYSVEQRSFAKRRGLQLLRLTSSRMPTPTTRFTVKKVPLRGGKDEPFLRETFGQKALKSNKNETKIRL